MSSTTSSTTSSSLPSGDQTRRSSPDDSTVETGRGRGRGRGQRGRRGRGQRGRGQRDRGQSHALGAGLEEEEGIGQRPQASQAAAEIPGAGAIPRQRRGRSAGGRARPRRLALSREDEERVEEIRRQRIELAERLLQDMNLEEHRNVTSRLLERQPGLVFDILLLRQRPQGEPTPVAVPGLPWCTCGNCTAMPTDTECKCCGQDPVNCVSLLPHFTQYCLDAGVLRIHRQYRADVTVLGEAREPGDDNREYRYAAYRHFIFWQHGSLGQGNRRVIPSCCVAKIRVHFPDPHGQYTGYIPGI